MLDVSVGAVTALALSHDHTFIASGHVTGFIQLFNLKVPKAPVRTVPPTSLTAVASGRKEGHLEGSKIVNVGFIAGRHTALVSADDHGLAFFHSLGKVLFIEATDILRILGRYPAVPSSHGLVRGTQSALSQTDQQRKQRYTILSMAPLPLGTNTHIIDDHHIVALLTPSKLVVVGLKPTPRTWFKIPRDQSTASSRDSKKIGSVSWFPSVTISNSANDIGQAGTREVTAPTLAFTWGNTLSLIKLTVSKVQQAVKNSKTGKSSTIDVEVVGFQAATKYQAESDILALQWLNHYVSSLNTLCLRFHSSTKFSNFFLCYKTNFACMTHNWRS